MVVGMAWTKMGPRGRRYPYNLQAFDFNKIDLLGSQMLAAAFIMVPSINFGGGAIPICAVVLALGCNKPDLAT